MTFLETDPSYHDPDDHLRDLLERQHLITQMQETEGWALWRDFLAAEQAGYQRRLLTGRHQDMLDYKFDAGFCEGIRFALGVSETLQTRVSTLRSNLELLSGTDVPLADKEND